LELIVRASSVATRAQHFAKHVKSSNPQFKGRIAGTRKTTPGLRLVEKYALMVAGVDTHRMDLSQMVMLKDNHIDVVGSIPNAVAMARSRAGFSCKIEVECRSVQDALVAAEAGADVVMLDNFSPADAAAAAKQVKDAFGPRVLVEVSGGIRTEKDLEAYASECVDVISMGTLTQAVVPVDFSLKIRK
jgi:nicotinate-nucleotide pyrophosphorylase (carboxylating)